jgi:hypothetical protein
MQVKSGKKNSSFATLFWCSLYCEEAAKKRLYASPDSKFSKAMR